MSVLDLKCRSTQDFEYFNRYSKSSDSHIYFGGNYIIDESGQECLKLTVGEKYYDSSRYIRMPGCGIKIKPRESIVIVVNEDISLPLNVFGIVFGVGRNIFQGGFVANGKIDPGFSGKLKIGYYNGGKKTIILKQGDTIAGCAFFEMQTSVKGVTNYEDNEPVIEFLNVNERIKRWLSTNWYATLTSLVGIAALIVAILK